MRLDRGVFDGARSGDLVGAYTSGFGDSAGLCGVGISAVWADFGDLGVELSAVSVWGLGVSVYSGAVDGGYVVAWWGAVAGNFLFLGGVTAGEWELAVIG